MSIANPLSSKVLQIVFQHIVDTSTWNEGRDVFVQCQRVCRGWLKPAQTELYKYIVVIKPDCTERFAKVVRDSSNIPGHLVKTIDFRFEKASSRRDDSTALQDIIYTILQHCPRLEKIGSSTFVDFETYFILPSLLAVKTLEHLEMFTLTDEWYPAKEAIYGQASLKFKATLSMLRLYPDPRSADSSQVTNFSQDTNFTALKNNLKEFASLKELQLYGASLEIPIITELDNLINYCPTTVHSLILDECKFLKNHNYPKEMQVNKSITRLWLKDLKMAASSVGYFAKKLASLETLTLSSRLNDLAQSNTPDEYDDWWNQMTLLCQPLQHYDISINDFKPEEYLHEIRGCANMTNTIAKYANSRTEITMCLSKSKNLTWSHILEMGQNNSRVRLFARDRHSMFTRHATYSEIFGTIQLFPPQTINILDVEEPNEILIIKSFAVLNGVISLTNDKVVSAVHLDKMIFPNPQEGFEPIRQDIISERTTSISEFKFTNCRFYSGMLSKTLKRLPKVDTLMLHECIIVEPLDSSGKIIIDIPETKLDRLELKSALFDMYGRVKIVLEIDGEMTMICKDIKKQEEASVSNKFYLSIKCKELQSLSVSGKEVFTSPNTRSMST